MEDAPSVEYVARYIAKIQQKYTQTGGVRPFGISTLMAGGDTKGNAKLYQTDPSGTFSAWKANAIGRNSKNLREFLEKNYEENLSEEKAIQLAMKALMEIVESGSKNIEVLVVGQGGQPTSISDDKIEEICKAIEAEKEEAKTDSK